METTHLGVMRQLPSVTDKAKVEFFFLFFCYLSIFLQTGKITTAFFLDLPNVDCLNGGVHHPFIPSIDYYLSIPRFQEGQGWRTSPGHF